MGFILAAEPRLIRKQHSRIMLIEFDYRNLVIEYNPAGNRCIGHPCSSEEGGRFSESSPVYMDIAQDACGRSFDDLVRMHLDGIEETRESNHSVYGKIIVRTYIGLPDIKRFHPWY